MSNEKGTLDVLYRKSFETRRVNGCFDLQNWRCRFCRCPNGIFLICRFCHFNDGEDAAWSIVGYQMQQFQFSLRGIGLRLPWFGLNVVSDAGNYRPGAWGWLVNTCNESSAVSNAGLLNQRFLFKWVCKVERLGGILTVDLLQFSS